MFRTLTIAAVLALTVTAAEAGDVTVRFDDLNTANPADAKVLAGRIHDAAAIACATDTDYGGARHLFYPELYQAAAEHCIRQVSLATIAKITAAAGEHPRYASN